MEKKKKNWTICLLFIIFFIGCREKEPENLIHLVFWGNSTTDEQIIEIVELFIEKNPDIIVEIDIIDLDIYWDKINTLAISRKPPSIIQLDYTHIAEYKQKNLLEDMRQYIEENIIDIFNWAETDLVYGEIDEKLVALSMGTKAWGMSVDPEVLEKADIIINDLEWTWLDFENIALAIYRKTGIKTLPIVQFHQIFEHISRQFNVPFFAEDQKSLGFTDNATVINAIKDVIDMNLRLKDAGALYDPEIAFTEKSIEEETISKNETWNAFYWSNQHIEYVNSAHRPLDYYVFPTISRNKEYFGTYLMPSRLISILAPSKNKEISAQFVDFILNDEEANRILLAKYGVPVPKHIRDDLYPLIDPNIKSVFDYITKVTPYTSPIPPPDPLFTNRVLDAMRPFLIEALTGVISSDLAIRHIIEAANNILNE